MKYSLSMPNWQDSDRDVFILNLKNCPMSPKDKSWMSNDGIVGICGSNPHCLEPKCGCWASQDCKHFHRGDVMQVDLHVNRRLVPNDEEEDYDKGTLYYCEKDIRIHTISVDRLLQTGWYYGSMSSPEAKKLLREHPVGTFVIRDSSDSKYLYSVSVKTPRGTTSVRILYHKGYFQLDCEDKIRSKMPKFDCVVELVDFYVRLSISDRNHICRWLESSGRKDLPILLKKPRLNAALDLKHLCRLTITRSLPPTTRTTKVKKYVDSLPIPGTIKDYLKDYPYLN